MSHKNAIKHGHIPAAKPHKRAGRLAKQQRQERAAARLAVKK